MISYVRLVDVRDWQLPCQAHATAPWIDHVTRQETSYLAGFATPEARAEYCRQQGYEVVS